MIDDYKRNVWIFNAFDFNIVFVGFQKEEKPPRKRLWRITKKWGKYSHRDNNITEPIYIPNHVKEKVRTEILNKIKVITWEEWKGKK